MFRLLKEIEIPFPHCASLDLHSPFLLYLLISTHNFMFFLLFLVMVVLFGLFQSLCGCGTILDWGVSWAAAINISVYICWRLVYFSVQCCFYY